MRTAHPIRSVQRRAQARNYMSTLHDGPGVAVELHQNVTLAESSTKPALHAQVKLPLVFEHVAFAWQLCVAAPHSLMSVHCAPEKPTGHVHVKLPAVSVHVAAPQFAMPALHSLMFAQPVLASPV